MSLKNYQNKRHFDRTPEPMGSKYSKSGQLEFVIQKHKASHLHYDLRLENQGVLKSWAVPKGPSLNPQERRLAVRVEDHPWDYRNFEGVIPEGNYGAGEVIVWDKGVYYVDKNLSRQENEREINQELNKGHLNFFLEGEKLKGKFTLVKLHRRNEDNQWFLIKKFDEYAGSKIENENSVNTGKGLNDVKSNEPVTNIKHTIKPEDLNGSKGSAMPDIFKPMLATTTDSAFDHENWLFEIKWDGYRALAFIHNKKVNLYSRSLNSFNAAYPPLVQAFKNYPFDAIFDGEIIVTDKNGLSSFQLLQNYHCSGEGQLMFYLFDIMYFNGHDLREMPLYKRKGLLKKVIPDSEYIRLSDDIPEKGISFFKEVRKYGLEGAIAKKRTSKYQPGRRSQDWLKIKIDQRQEVIIGGFTAPQGSRGYFGALILGVYENKDLVYVGHTGSGFSEELLKSLHKKLEPLITKDCPFRKAPKPNMPVTWVKPELVCEIKFLEWTDEWHMRHPIFVGLREDKLPTEVFREQKQKIEKLVEHPQSREQMQKNNLHSNENKESSEMRHIELTNLLKIYWPEEGFTKSDVINYYRDMADIILPYLKDRPQSLNRHPDGITGESFFQKDMDKTPDWIPTIPVESESHKGKINYLICNDAQTLTYLNNLGCIELNVWNSRIQYPQYPDYMVFDLDPLDSPFINVVKVALSVKQLLDELKMPGYCKTSGGKGLHIYVPLGHLYDFNQVKDFSYLLCSLAHDQMRELTSLERSPLKRKGRVYLDFLQNRYSATMAAPYAIRPRRGATVSAPLAWEEVNEKLNPFDFNINTMRDRVRKKGDLWKGALDQEISMIDILENL